MLTHAGIWAAIDRLAAANKLTVSALARRAGLDPTTFNRSKRVAPDGRPRWPSTESIAKILAATRTPLAEFLPLVGTGSASDAAPTSGRIPLLGLARAGTGGFFDDSGLPAGEGWEQVELPGGSDHGVYALEVSGDSMLPLYRSGDVIIVSPAVACRRGDRVVVRTRAGEVMAKVLKRRTTETFELASLNPEHPDRSLGLAEVAWVARIIWASQ